MFRKILKATVLVILVAGVSSIGFADTINKTINLQASITSHQALNITITPIDPGTDSGPQDDQWLDSLSGTTIDFNLSFNDTYKIWMADRYYAIDVGLETNDPNWKLTISGDSFTRQNGDGITADLDYNINAGLFSVLPDPNGDGDHSDDVQTPIDGNISYYDLIHYGNIDASNVPSGQFLRIYLGVATGKDDAEGVSPIGLDKPAGTYSGTIELSFTAN